VVRSYGPAPFFPVAAVLIAAAIAFALSQDVISSFGQQAAGPLQAEAA
jgi:hypothetical protein